MELLLAFDVIFDAGQILGTAVGCGVYTAHHLNLHHTLLLDHQLDTCLAFCLDHWLVLHMGHC